MKSAKLGQHFIVSQTTLRRLVEQIPPPSKRVLEIGTGDGRLTEKLLEAGHVVTSYELDGVLFEEARKRLGDVRTLTLVEGDGFLDYGNYDALVSSLPYYASRRFVEWFAATWTPLGVVVLQKDFVDKLLSRPGGKRYGAYSVLASLCFEIHQLMVIPPTEFEPRPRVYSVALRMQRKRTLTDVKLSTIRLKGLFAYRGRLVASYVRDLTKKGLWNASLEVGESLLRRRVEDLEPHEAWDLVRGVISD